MTLSQSNTNESRRFNDDATLLSKLKKQFSQIAHKFDFYQAREQAKPKKTKQKHRFNSIHNRQNELKNIREREHVDDRDIALA